VIDNHNDSIFTRLRPTTIVDLLAQKADRFEGKDDIRRSRILDVIPPYVIIEQSVPKLPPRRIGDTIEVTYLHKHKDETKKRVIVKMTLVAIDRYKLKETLTEALFFVSYSDTYHGTLRRHYRIEIPQYQNVVIEITNLEGEHIGLKQTYKATDLSLQGLKFLCPRTVRHKKKLLQDPVGKFSTRDEILVKIFIDNEETEKIRFETYAEKHKNAMLPHIIELQRQLLKKQSDL
jgi:hypothetical protein